MSKNSSRSNAGGNGGSGFPVFAAIMLGIVMGLAIAGGIAYLVVKKAPVSLAPKEPPKVVPEPEKKPAPAAKPATPGEDKARFEFYKELTDKPDSSKPRKVEKPTPPVAKPTPHPAASAVSSTKPADKTTYFLQAGSFPNPDDAEKVKAKLAFMGMEANVQPANIPDKGTWYRVRLGPYHGTDDMNAALNTLKLNGINAAPIRAQ